MTTSPKNCKQRYCYPNSLKVSLTLVKKHILSHKTFEVLIECLS